MAGDAPSGFVLKAYKTEANAISDSDALKVISSKAYVTNKQQAAGFNFFTHEKYFFRIEANESVKEFYIDWDDGEDNNPTGNANFSKIILDYPSNVGITSHIFTRDKIHFPKIRVKSVDGYLSKFYQPFGDQTFTGIDVLTDSMDTLAEGRNDTYRIEADVGVAAGSEAIPIFAPTPKPPVSILKADKKRIFAGITNKYLGGTGGSFDGLTCRLIGSHATMDSARGEVKVRVTFYAGGADQGDLANTGSGELVVTDMTLAGTPTIANVLSVVKMELVDLLEDTVDMTNAGSASAVKSLSQE